VRPVRFARGVAVFTPLLLFVCCGGRTPLAFVAGSGAENENAAGGFSGSEGSAGTAAVGHPTVTCDADGDGHLAATCGGDDCDDENADRYPGAIDAPPGPVAWAGEQALLHHAGDVRGQPAIAIDAQGALHVAHAGAGGGVTYATSSSGDWVATELDPGGRGRAGLALADEIVHVVYAGAADVMHASGSAVTEWALEPIAAGQDPAIAVGPDGSLHVVYQTGDGGIGYARFGVERWVVERVAEHGSAPVVAVAEDGTVHLAWTDSSGAPEQGVKHARQTSHGFEVETVSPGPFTAVSLLLRPDGSPVLAFAPLSTTDPGAKVASLEHDGWHTVSALATHGYVWSTAILLDRVGRVNVVACGEAADLAVESGDGFVGQPIRLEGYGCGAVFGRSGDLHVAYSHFYFPDITAVEHVVNVAALPDGIDEDCDGVDG